MNLIFPSLFFSSLIFFLIFEFIHLFSSYFFFVYLNLYTFSSLLFLFRSYIWIYTPIFFSSYFFRIFEFTHLLFSSLLISFLYLNLYTFSFLLIRIKLNTKDDIQFENPTRHQRKRARQKTIEKRTRKMDGGTERAIRRWRRRPPVRRQGQGECRLDVRGGSSEANPRR